MKLGTREINRLRLNRCKTDSFNQVCEFERQGNHTSWTVSRAPLTFKCLQGLLIVDVQNGLSFQLRQGQQRRIKQGTSFRVIAAEDASVMAQKGVPVTGDVRVSAARFTRCGNVDGYLFFEDGRAWTYRGNQPGIGAWLKPYSDRWGYVRVAHTYIHRALAQLFIPNPEGKPQVNHLDGNKENFSVSNLEWCTNSENRLHAITALGFSGQAHAVSSTWRLKRYAANVGKVAVITGCFDGPNGLHEGHEFLLSEARRLLPDHKIVVLLDTDDYIRKCKDRKPIRSYRFRQSKLRQNPNVDAIFKKSDDSPLNMIMAANASALVCGSDYAPSDIIGSEFVKSNSGKIIIVPRINISTSMFCKPTDESFMCRDCGLDTHRNWPEQYYMLTNKLWESIFPEEWGMLCLECAEKRLGRPLVASDFTDTPINQMSSGASKRINRKDV